MITYRAKSAREDLIKNNNQKLAVKEKKLKNLAVLYTAEFILGSLLPIWGPISD